MHIIITNNTRSVVSINSTLGVVQALSVKTADLSLNELEKIAPRLHELQQAGLISFSVTPTTSSNDDFAEGATIAYLQSNFFPTFPAVTRYVYVAATGDDDTGDGTRDNPWATVARAFRDAPKIIRQESTSDSINYVIRIVAPYDGPLGKMSYIVQEYTQIPGNGLLPPNFSIVVQSWTNSADLGGVDDPRYTLVAGPLTPSAAVVFAGNRAKYTMPGGTITVNDQWSGNFVRIYQGGVEVARGIILRTVLSTQELLVHPTQDYVPAVTDEIRIVQPSVNLGGIPGGATQTSSQVRALTEGTFTTVRFENIRIMDSLTVSGNSFCIFSGCQLNANGGGGACNTSDNGHAFLSPSTLSGVSIDTTLQPGSVLVRTGGGFCCAGRISLSNGCVLLGDYWPGNFPATGLFTINSTATLRGKITLTGRMEGRVNLSGPSVAKPTLLIHRSAGAILDAGVGAQIVTQGVIAVDAGAALGNVFTIKDARMMAFSTATQLVPADSGVPTMASGIPVEVQRDGSAQVNTTSTLAGAGGVDVKAGDNAGLTWAALAAIVGPPAKRSTDSGKQATVWAP